MCDPSCVRKEACDPTGLSRRERKADGGPVRTLPAQTRSQGTHAAVRRRTFCRHSRTLLMYSSWHWYGWKGKSTVTPLRAILGMLACSQEGPEAGGHTGCVSVGDKISSGHLGVSASAGQ